MISVCIATYNGAATIHVQIASILPQLSYKDEIIVSDDSSSDSTLQIVQAFQSPIIKIIQGPSTGSPISNFEHALRHAKGDIIFLSDQDDCWVEGKIEAMRTTLQEGWDCVVSDCYITDEDLNIKFSSFFQETKMKEGYWYNLLVHNYYLGCCMAFKRQVLQKALPFPPNIPMHDIWIGNVAATFFNVKFLSLPLIYFRRHQHNASCTAAKSPYTFWEKLRFRFRIIFSLFLRRFRKH